MYFVDIATCHVFFFWHLHQYDLYYGYIHYCDEMILHSRQAIFREILDMYPTLYTMYLLSITSPIMSEQDFQQQVLTALSRIETDVSTLKSDVSGIKEDLATFKASQEEFNQASWKLHTQAFQAINDIRSEVVSPWKIRASQNV